MSKIPKNLLIISIILALLTSISNYSNSSENIDDLAYVMAIGIDVGTNTRYKITLLLSTIESSATEALSKSSSDGSSSSSNASSSSSNDSGSKSSSGGFEVYSMECESIDTAINIADTFINKDITLSHCKTLVISETLAKQGIKNLINTLINKVEIRPDCNIIISRIPKEEFEGETPPSIDEILTKYYDITSNMETHTAYNQTVELTKFYSNLNDSLSQPYAALGNVSNPKSNAHSNNSNDLDVQAKSLSNPSLEYAVETIGLAVFKDDIMVGSLNGFENMCHLLITNNFDNCIINIPNPIKQGENIDLYLFGIKNTRTNVKIVNDSPHITTNISVATKILSTNDNLEIVTQEKIDIIENAATEYLKKQLYNYLDKSSKEFKSDISEIGKYAIKNFKTIDEWDNYNWLEKYTNSTFNINIKMSMRTGILLTTE